MLVDRLEQAGWVKRSAHPSDRRYVLVELSATVLERTPPGLAGYHARIRAVAAEVPAEHREALRSFLLAAADTASAAAVQLRR